MQRNNTREKELIQKAKATRIVSNFEMAEILKKRPPLKTVKADSFPKLSKAIDGFMAGELVVITGDTGCGKTLLCHTLTKDFCHSQLYPMWLSYEVPPMYFINKFSSLLQFYLPVELEPYSIAWIQEIIKRGKSEKAVSIVFIDHLHYIYDMSRAMQASLDIGVIVRSLKRLAVEQELIIFMVCHTNRSSADKIEDIGLNRIRDSSFVAQESDTTIFIHREQVDDGVCSTNEACLKVCKARRTGVMSKIISIKKTGEFLEEC